MPTRRCASAPRRRNTNGGPCDYNRQPDAFDDVFPYWPYNPIAYNDVYRLPDGLVLDVDGDGDGMGEHLLMIDHPAACDTEGCDVLVLEGEVQAEAPTDFRLVGVLHLPFAALGSARILIVDEEFVFLESARDLLLHATIDGAHVKNVIGERYGAMVFDRLDTRDMGFASVGLNGDQRPEVFSAIADYTDCGTRGNCGGAIITPLSEDTDGPYPWRWRETTSFDTPIRPTMTFSVSPDFVRGWRVLRFGDACWAWLDGRYQVFSHATFRLIPVQGCFE